MLNLPFVLLLTSLLLPEIYIAGKYAPISHFVMIVAIPLLFVKYTAFRGLLIRRFYSFFLLLFFVSIWIIVNSSYLPSPYLTGVVSIVAATGYYMLMPVFNYHNPSNPTRILDAYVKVWIVLIGLNLLMILIAATGLVGSWPEYSQFNRLILTTGNYINFSNMTFGSAMFGTESGTSTSSISTVCALLFIHVFTNRFNDKYAIITLLVLLLGIEFTKSRAGYVVIFLYWAIEALKNPRKNLGKFTVSVKRLKYLIVSVLTIVVVATIGIAYNYTSAFSKIFNTVEGGWATIYGRLELYVIALTVWVTSFRTLFFGVAGEYSHTYYESLYIDTLASYGLLILFGIGFFLFQVIKYIKRFEFQVKYYSGVNIVSAFQSLLVLSMVSGSQVINVHVTLILCALLSCSTKYDPKS